MPLLVPILIWFATGFAARVLLSLGLGLFSFSLINDFQAEVQESILNSLSGLPASVFQLIGFFGVDKYISIILSALAMAAYIKATAISIGRT